MPMKIIKSEDYITICMLIPCIFQLYTGLINAYIAFKCMCRRKNVLYV